MNLLYFNPLIYLYLGILHPQRKPWTYPYQHTLYFRLTNILKTIVKIKKYSFSRVQECNFLKGHLTSQTPKLPHMWISRLHQTRSLLLLNVKLMLHDHNPMFQNRGITLQICSIYQLNMLRKKFGPSVFFIFLNIQLWFSIIEKAGTALEVLRDVLDTIDTQHPEVFTARCILFC